MKNVALEQGSWAVGFETPFGLAAAIGLGDSVRRILLPAGPGKGPAGDFVEFGHGPTRARMKKLLGRFASGQGHAPPIDLPWSSPFDHEVLILIAAVPRGSVATYGGIAAAMGRPSCSRAVGGAAGRNPLPILVPCHRVVGSDGRLTGFSARGGLSLKRRMLEVEGVRFLPGPVPRVDMSFNLTPRSKRL